MNNLTITSLQAPNADPFIARLADYLSSKLEATIEFISEPAWQERERLLDSGIVDIGWICGLPYIWKAALHPPRLELLAAPVMSALRYNNSPIYFSDVIVLKSSPFRRFSDLRGARWAYNEPHSHSGFNVTRWRLAEMGEERGFFGQAVEAGSHQSALEMVLSGEVDASAIDSTVLETETGILPELVDRLRVIEVLGPSPIPPFVINLQIPVEVRQRVRETLLGMRRDPDGQVLLNAYRHRRFAAVTDADYDLIREMERKAQSVRLDAVHSD